MNQLLKHSGRFCAFAAIIVISAGALQAQTVSLNGSGATFPAVLYQQWATEFNAQTGIEVNYQAIGSGGGQKAIADQTVDFAGSDAFYAGTEGVINIPTVAGAVVITYNVPELGSCTLKLSASTLADIFLGTITQWNDSAIANDNAGCALPDRSILVVHRSDGSGTTNIFTSYLSSVSSEWSTQVGFGTSVNWPTDALSGLAGKGNAGVSQTITQNPDSLGYVELIYALQNQLPTANLENPQGQFVQPSLESTAAALGGLSEIPTDFNISPLILNVDAPGAYPIVGPTYLLVYKDLRNLHDAAKAQALVDFLCWAINSNGQSLGQDFANGLDFARLPANITAEANHRIKALTFQGNPVDASRFCK